MTLIPHHGDHKVPWSPSPLSWWGQFCDSLAEASTTLYVLEAYPVTHCSRLSMLARICELHTPLGPYRWGEVLPTGCEVSLQFPSHSASTRRIASLHGMHRGADVVLGMVLTTSSTAPRLVFQCLLGTPSSMVTWLRRIHAANTC